MKPFKLDEHQFDPGFRIPEGYFDALQQQVSAKIAKTKDIPLYRKPWFYATAAAEDGGLGITYFNAVATPTVSTSVAIENYLAAQPLTQDLLVELLETEDLDQLQAEHQFDQEVLEETLSHTNIENLIY